MRDLRGDDKSSMHQLPFPSLNAKLIRRKCRNHRSMGLALKVTSMERMNVSANLAGDKLNSVLYYSDKIDKLKSWSTSWDWYGSLEDNSIFIHYPITSWCSAEDSYSCRNL
ncbi:hypothetical protein Bca101_054272 [Brassica carinata]